VSPVALTDVEWHEMELVVTDKQRAESLSVAADRAAGRDLGLFKVHSHKYADNADKDPACTREHLPRLKFSQLAATAAVDPLATLTNGLQ
jgi:hypothetical protein